MLNKHGLKMIGLKKTVGDMTNGGHYGNHNQVNYDMKTGKVWIDECTQNNWMHYYNPSVITVGNYCNKLTMQELADEIARAIERKKEKEKENEMWIKEVNEAIKGTNENWREHLEYLQSEMEKEEE